MTEIIIREERQRQELVKFVMGLDISKPWRAEICRYRKKRSLNQNAMYWKWLGIVADETGNDPDELHEFFKGKYLVPTIIQVGDDRMLYRSTTKLDTVEMSAFMDKVYAFVTAELGILLPIPEDQHERAA